MTPKPGTIYRLTRDVTNPKPDRRKAERETFSQPVLECGLLLVCRDHYGPTLVPYGRGYWQTGGYDNRISATSSPQAYARQGRALGPSLWELLTADGVLDEVEPTTADEVLMGLDGYSDPSAVVLEHLVSMGKVTLDDVRTAYQAARAAGEC